MTFWESIAREQKRRPEDREFAKFLRQVCRQFPDAEWLETDPRLSPVWSWKIVQQSGGAQERAVRLLLEDESGRRCETVVLMPSGRPEQRATVRLPRATACVSSQPGCGVGCPFCATGVLGYQGNLNYAQIIEQVYWAGVIARRERRQLRNVVFMGMGEPLHNPEAVFKALETLIDERLFGVPSRRITVSTAGVPTQMLRLAERFPRLRIALSLHAAQPALRRKLVPRATGDLDLLRDTIRQVNELQPSTPLWLEVVLLAGLNDDDDCALSLVKFCRDLRVEVNLIPYNPAAVAGSFQPASKTSRERFASILRDAGIRTSFRTSFGADRNAACGQLNAAMA